MNKLKMDHKEFATKGKPQEIIAILLFWVIIVFKIFNISICWLSRSSWHTLDNLLMIILCQEYASTYTNA